MSDDGVVIKKIKKVAGHGHHGGAWKVAYADFVTAMMAFFLLMWLINTTSPEQKRGIADYFAPASVSKSTSGSGGILDGTSFGQDGGRSGGAVSVVVKMTPADSDAKPKTPSDAEPAQEMRRSTSEEEDAEISEASQVELESAQISLRQAMQDMPELAELSKHILMDMTPEGLRIQLVDQEGRPMFQAGSAEPSERLRTLLAEVSRVAKDLPNRIAISGHTDGGNADAGGGTYSNWELSTDRANASRRILMDYGVEADRVYQVSGKAGSEPLLPEDPSASANRRISILLLKEAPPLPPGAAP
jgi:chemotaxis protein MotB